MVFIGITILLLVGIVGYFVIEPYIPNGKTENFYIARGLENSRGFVVLGDMLLKEADAPLIKDGQIYLSTDFVKDEIDTYLLADMAAGRVTVTSESSCIYFTRGSLDYTVNDADFTLDLPVISDGGKLYMPAKLLTALYGVTVRYEPEYKLVIVDLQGIRLYEATVTRDTAVRYESDIKSPIAVKLKKGAVVLSFDEEGDFTLVRLDSGVIGYVKTKDLSAPLALPLNERKPEVAKKPALLPYVAMAWDQIWTYEANAKESLYQKPDRLNVLCPTWFSFSTEPLDGTIKNIADVGYVEWAHANDIQVWGMLTDNFDSQVSNYVLTNTNVREKVIRQVLELVALYKLDGINIDFEMVKKADADYYIQFLRELAPRLHEMGAILSVDMYVPKDYNLYYNRTEVAKVADYIVIMGYDEHAGNSPVAGPVASFGFVESGVVETIKEAAPEQVILGMPFYSRLWREVLDENGEITALKPRALGMDYAYRLVTEAGGVFEWDAVAGSNYAEYKATEDGESVRYKIWLEDERSFGLRMNLVNQYKLAGFAGWSRGLEKDAIWQFKTSD